MRCGEKSYCIIYPAVTSEDVCRGIRSVKSLTKNKHYAVDRKHKCYFIARHFLCLIMPYQFAGCVLIWNNGGLLSNEIWARVTVEYKRVVISYTRSLSTIAIIARRTSLLFSVQSYCSFSLHLPGHRPAD